MLADIMLTQIGRRASVALALLSLGFALHCGTNGGSAFDDDAVCNGSLAGKCGGACALDDDCPSGTFCGTAGTCTAQCANGSTCADGQRCSAHGRCGGLDTFGADFDAGSDPGSTGDGGACADLQLTLGKTEPTVVLLVDQSNSMVASFSGGTRWTVIKSVLLDDPAGLIKPLEGDVRFGLTMFANDTSDSKCPDLTSVDHALDNYAAIKGVFGPAGTKPNTPTGESIRAVAGLDASGNAIPGGFAAEDAPGPKIIVLATDGDPDSCADPTANDDPTTTARRRAAQDIAVVATQQAFAAGIRTYVIAVGDEIQASNQQEIANAGLGFAPNGGALAPFYRPTDSATLATQLRQIVDGVRSCTFSLNGSVQAGKEASGTVSLNGTPLTYGDANGWQLNSPTELELRGTACDTIKSSSSAQLSASFPCDAVSNVR